MTPEQKQVFLRWRLLLGQYSESCFEQGPALDAQALARAQALDWLYSREYAGRGVRSQDRSGGRGSTQLEVVQWVSKIRKLFPQETVELVQKHALERYGLKELVSDPQLLEKLEPNLDLAATLLSFRDFLSPAVLTQARKIIRSVVQELQDQLRQEFQRSRQGLRRSAHWQPQGELRNLDLPATIRRNLRYWDAHKKQLGVRELRFFERGQRYMAKRIVLCVDQSGSMAHSLIHSSVMASILAGLNHVEARLIVFDTSVVDLSSICEDPVEVLMSVQLGGGTNIGQALRYAEQEIDDPRRSVVVLISDFFEGVDPGVMLGAVERMHESGIKMLGLAALDQNALPSYDTTSAAQLSARGMSIAALTPAKLAQWLLEVIS